MSALSPRAPRRMWIQARIWVISAISPAARSRVWVRDPSRRRRQWRALAERQARQRGPGSAGLEDRDVDRPSPLGRPPASAPRLAQLRPAYGYRAIYMSIAIGKGVR